MSLNKVILIGNVGRDPEVRYFDSNSAQATFSLATSDRGYTLANGTVVPERTEWHNIVARRDLVQFVEKWVKKGSGLYIEGKLRYRNYDDQNGIKRYITEIYADKIDFFTFGVRREDGQTNQATQPATGSAQPATQFTSPEQTYQSPSQPTQPFETNDADDLPF